MTVDEITELRQRLASIERRIQGMRTIAVFVGLAVILVAARKNEVLRVRGLVILDEAGRERIVLGAPLRNVSANSNVAATTGLVVVDSEGRLNVAVGSNNPAIGSNGKLVSRIMGSAGMTIYDPRTGGERGGFGTLVDGRANLCLDYSTGKEAACMSVAPLDQNSSVMLQGTPNEPQFDRVGMFLSADGGGSVKAFGGGANESGMMIKVGKGKPALMVVDSTQKIIRDLATPQ
jgi:hypothetical protein